MSEIEIAKSGTLSKFEPDKAAMRIHSLEAAERVAKAIKDWVRLGDALREKLEEQAEFVAHYRALFPHGDGPGRGHKRDDRGGDSFPAAKFCQSHGFGDRTVQRWGEALLDDDNQVSATGIQTVWDERLPKAAKIALMEQAANYSSESVEWYTPGLYIDAVRDVFDGTISLDPASSALANETVEAEKFYSEAENGLKQDWFGKVFLNPPYGVTDSGDSVASMFCQKAIGEYETGRVDAAIVLVNSVHSQKWQAPLYQFPVCFVAHRIQFVSGDGQKNKNPTFQNIFIYLGQAPQRFADVFSEIGYVMRRIAT